MRYDSTPTGRYLKQFDSMFWKSSPYGWPVIGWTSDLEAITREDAMAYFGANYAPNNLTACLVGDFDPAQAVELAKKYFGRLQRGAREIWEVKNSPISMPHPMHLHGFGFRVLRRQGTYGAARALASAPGGRFATDLGVKDTVLVWPNETLWLAIDFTLPREAAFAGAQRFMFHCHNLEHEDGMMMRNITVA